VSHVDDIVPLLESGLAIKLTGRRNGVTYSYSLSAPSRANVPASDHIARVLVDSTDPEFPGMHSSPDKAATKVFPLSRTLAGHCTLDTRTIQLVSVEITAPVLVMA
jgi:hypothetical protein